MRDENYHPRDYTFQLSYVLDSKNVDMCWLRDYVGPRKSIRHIDAEEDDDGSTVKVAIELVPDSLRDDTIYESYHRLECGKIVNLKLRVCRY